MSRTSPLLDDDFHALVMNENGRNHWHVCRGTEGWGIFAPSDSLLNPCFLHGIEMALSVWALLAGVSTIHYLRLAPTRTLNPRWHLYVKLAMSTTLMVLVLAQGITDDKLLQNIQLGDVFVIINLLIIMTVQYLDHWRSRLPNRVALVYWTASLTLSASKIHSLVLQQQLWDPYLMTNLVLVTLQLGIEGLLRPASTSDMNQCPAETASLLSYLTFSWMAPMMKRGYSQYLTESDMWNLRERDLASVCHDAFERAWTAQMNRPERPNLWLALFRAFGVTYFRAAFLKLAADSLKVLQPQLLHRLIIFAHSRRSASSVDPQSPVVGALIAFAMFGVSVCSTLCLHQYYQRVLETGMRVKSALVTVVYSKSMRLSNQARSLSGGTDVNLMAVDAQVLQDLCQHGQQIWSAPLQIVLCLALLYQFVGMSLFAGVGVMLVALVFGAVTARLMETLQVRQLKNKDARMKLTTEILYNIKAIKLYDWTAAFTRKIGSTRGQELRMLRKIGALRGCITFIWSAAPSLISTSIFATFVTMQRTPLSTEIVFPAVALFNILTLALAVFPHTITAWVSAHVAVGRLTDFLLAPELQVDAVMRLPPTVANEQGTVLIQNATFAWDREQGGNVLHGIEFSAFAGQLSCVTGRVGSGKSSLLASLLGELYKVEGKVIVRGTLAYVPQTPWLMNASIQDNITFGNRYDKHLYRRTIRACALQSDLDSLQDGHDTIVGERGISLSGGQKARIALARAVYSNADIYILDDVLSAVDQHVGRHLVENVLGRRGVLAGRTRILATNSVNAFRQAQYCTLLSGGRIVEHGTYEKIRTVEGEIDRLQPEDKLESELEDHNAIERRPRWHMPTNALRSDNSMVAAAIDTEIDDSSTELHMDFTDRHAGLAASRRSSHASSRLSEHTLHNTQDTIPRSRMESSTRGEVKWDVYLKFIGACGWAGTALYLMLSITAQLGFVGEGLWLKHWSKANEDTGSNQRIMWYLGVYCAFGGTSATLALLQTLTLWLACSTRASKALHSMMLHAVLRAPMSFFESTPVGQVLNRFSGDVQRVDEVLAEAFDMLLVSIVRAGFTLSLIAWVTPAFILIIVPLSVAYMAIQGYYRRTSRELKRLQSVTRSPIYSHFQESLAGVTTIRAQGHLERFLADNKSLMDTNSRAYFASMSVSRWLGVRLEFLGAIVILSAAGCMVHEAVYGWSGRFSSGLVGVAMSAALQITEVLNLIVKQTVALENNIVSAERVLEYANLHSEAPEITNKPPPASWPSRGAIRFEEFSTRYRPDLGLALKCINVDISSHEKVGVVGRTGAGKSSLIYALFRIIEASSGSISIDGLPISTVGLRELRSRISIIPQDAALFDATVRENLDPRDDFDDTALWSALERAGLRERIAALPGGLDARLRVDGGNLSHGQRQLVSVARALLTQANILVLDEATAAVDTETDAQLQATFRGPAFKDRTIITIAHRIDTIMDYDRILVLEDGHVKEFDTPEALIAQQGLFYQLVAEAGLLIR